MLPSWFMSMWIFNGAATAMMLPIVEAVLPWLDPAAAHGDTTIGLQEDQVVLNIFVINIETTI